MPVGKELKQARERAALSIEQIAERTKIQPHKIEALESEDFDPLPHGIYLEGIVRAYAHEVGIDPEPLVDRIRSEHPQPAGVWTAPVVLNGVHGDTAVHKIEDIDVFVGEDIEAFPTEDAGSFPSEEPAAATTLPHGDMARRPREMELARPMMLVLATAALAVVLSLSTNIFDSDDSPDEIFSVPTAPAKPATGAARVQPPAETSPVERSSTSETSPDISGRWTLNTRIDSTSYSRFEGLKLGYQLDLRRDGDRVFGEGRKVTENGRHIRTAAQTPITVDGTLEGDRMTLAFTEQGRRRPTRGTFELQVAENDALHGRFSSTAARSSGVVSAQRVQQ
jgi:hypothetical protein